MDLAVRNIVIFSDLDGCLLDKATYSFAAAIPTLTRIRELEIPLILASSKTEPEMKRLAEEMQLEDAPLICENGGVIFWSRKVDDTANKLVLGVERTSILQVLQRLKSRFHFSSFEDMQVEGVMAATELPRDRAEAALQRSCTEPLIWEDEAGKLADFEAGLVSVGLSLTRGGRFWHVAGQTNKGTALQAILERLAVDGQSNCTSVAIGDSPIDQSMLDVADYPIAIPAPDGRVQVKVIGENSRVARAPGPEGWAQTVSSVLNELR